MRFQTELKLKEGGEGFSPFKVELSGDKNISDDLPDRPFTGLRQHDSGLGDISSTNNNSGQPELDLF